MKHLNNMKGFNWVSEVNNIHNLTKVSIGRESFWIRECVKKGDIWEGIVDNDLVFTYEHNLKYNDVVSFKEE